MSVIVNVTGSGSGTITQVSTDPVSPVAGDVWVLRSGGDAGTPIGLLLSLTYMGFIYQLSYQTNEATTVRVLLS